MKRNSGPVDHVKKGTVTIPIYWSEDRQSYLAKWFEDGKPRKKRSKDIAKLKASLRDYAKAMDARALDLSGITAAQRAAIEMVLERGITVSDLERLQGVQEATVAEAVDRFLDAKHDASAPYLRNLRSHFAALIADMGEAPISSIATADLNVWLRRRASTLRTRKNKRNSLVCLWRWARDNDLVPQDTRTVAERTDKPSMRQHKRQRATLTWSPAELKVMLEVCPAEYLPWLTIQAFAGLRSLEIFSHYYSTEVPKQVLAWEDIDFPGKRIVVPAAVSKTADKRVVPISDNLLAWLKTFPNRRGPVCPHPVPWKALARWSSRSLLDVLEDALECPWRQNALRHSYGSYSVLREGGVGRVALAMGNSERMIRTHYLDVGRTDEEAEQWFSMTPAMVDRTLRVVGSLSHPVKV